MCMALFVCTTKQHYVQSHGLAKQDDACHTNAMYDVMLSAEASLEDATDLLIATVGDLLKGFDKVGHWKLIAAAKKYKKSATTATNALVKDNAWPSERSGDRDPRRWKHSATAASKRPETSWGVAVELSDRARLSQCACP